MLKYLGLFQSLKFYCYANWFPRIHTRLQLEKEGHLHHQIWKFNLTVECILPLWARKNVKELKTFPD